MSQRVRRARGVVLSTFAAFSALTVGLNIALDTFGARWRDPEYGHRLRELKPMVKKSQRQCVVALGSSRSQMGFNPAKMGLDSDQDPLVYNLSQAGCGPPQQYLNLCRLLRDGVRPDYLLVEILPPVMANRGPIEKSFQVEKLSYQDLQTVSHYFSMPDALTKTGSVGNRGKIFFGRRWCITAGCRTSTKPSPKRSGRMASIRLDSSICRIFQSLSSHQCRRNRMTTCWSWPSSTTSAWRSTRCRNL
jgi:hypothetical protein